MTESAETERGRRTPGVLIIAVVVLVAVALAAFFVFRRVDVRVIEFSPSEDGRVLMVGADACKGDAQIVAEETDDAVTIRATAERKWFGGQTICAVESLPIQLDEPLGERAVLDAFTGEPVPDSPSP